MSWYTQASWISKKIAKRYDIIPSRAIRIFVYYVIFLLLLTGIVQPNILDFGTETGSPVIASIVMAQQVAKEQQDGSLQFESLLTDSADDQRLVYTVKPGESLGMIAKQFGTSAKELLQANDLADADLLRSGQKIIISYSRNQLIYEVEEETTARDFALEYELDLEELMSLNFIGDESKQLSLGDQILIDLSVPDAQRRGLYQKPEYETPEELLALDNVGVGDDNLVLDDMYLEDDLLIAIDSVTDSNVWWEAGQRIISAEETTNNFDENELRQLQEIKNRELEASIAEEAKKQAEIAASTPNPTTRAPTVATPNAPAAPVQQRVIEATATSTICGSNKCSYNGKCWYLPANASCAGSGASEARSCNAWYVESSSQCITKDAYEKKTQIAQARAVTRPAKHGVVSQRYFNPYNDGYGNGRAWGHCTHGAGRRRWKNYGIMTNWRGNGGQWYYNASAAWWQVGKSPEVWSIFSTKWAAENWWYGHVWVVTQIDRASGSMMVVDMNYVRQYTFSQRRVPIQMPGLIWFIYPRKK